MLEKKDYDMKIRSFDAEFHCGSFLYFHICILYVYFYVKNINDTNHAREKDYDMIFRWFDTSCSCVFFF